MMAPNSPEYQQQQQMQQIQQQEQEVEAKTQQELQKQTQAAQIAALEAQAQSLIMQYQSNMTDKMFDNQLDAEEFEHKKFVDIEKLNIERKRNSVNG